MSVPASIRELVRAFHKDERTYYDSGYSEAQVRIQYIDPFLEALGWHPRPDPAYIAEWRDCIVEQPVNIKEEPHKKRADYTCRIGKSPVLIVEAKAPHQDVFTMPTHAMQIRRYAYSQGLPIGVLTNFAQLAIYDGRVQPKKGDTHRVAQIETIRFSEYEHKWELIESLLSKDAIQRGAQRDFMQRRLAKGLVPVNQAILADIDRWREELAHVIARLNPKLDAGALGFAVGRIIDRILFLRVCEARDTEPEGRLQSLVKGRDVYPRLLKLFHQADERYNSGLFHFTEERGRSEKPDTLAEKLRVEDKPLRQIISGLYYPENLYEYSVIPVEILGQVYEQFLGKVITIPRRGAAKIEDKPEVKKAGGVYYTPSYIVDYIVAHTVGKLVEGKTPRQIAKLRVLDPACGSGSFLLGAYQALLDWYLKYYITDGPAKHQQEICPDLREDYRLTLRERKRILLAHIYGVDIDPQAVEVAKLSLLLKVLEGETRESVELELKLRERALPDLGRNIKCGNSLIGTDILTMTFPAAHEEAKQGAGRRKQAAEEPLSDAEILRINPFDWHKEFPAVFKDGGFDAVIGNPPYGARFSEHSLDYLKIQYVTHVWRGESYLHFVERAACLLRTGGQFGYIVPDTYLNLGFTQSLRAFLLENTRLNEIVVLPSNVFPAATVDTTLLFFEKALAEQGFHVAKVLIRVFDKKRPIHSVENPTRQFEANTEHWFRQRSFNVASDPDEYAIINRAESAALTVANIAEMFYGIKAYQVGKGNPPQTTKIRDTKPFTSIKRSDKTFFPFYDGKHVGRYNLFWRQNNWVKYGQWLAEPRSPDKYSGEKILVRKIVSETLIATYVPETSYCNTLLFVLKLKPKSKFHYYYMLGILNSKFIGWYYRKKFQINRDDTFPQIMIRDILQIPLPMSDKSRHDKLVKLVERMLKLHADLKSEWIGPNQEKIERQIKAADAEIDRLVYELYGLTEDEIRLVESS